MATEAGCMILVNMHNLRAHLSKTVQIFVQKFCPMRCDSLRGREELQQKQVRLIYLFKQKGGYSMRGIWPRQWYGVKYWLLLLRLDWHNASTYYGGGPRSGTGGFINANGSILRTTA